MNDKNDKKITSSIVLRMKSYLTNNGSLKNICIIHRSLFIISKERHLRFVAFPVERSVDPAKAQSQAVYRKSTMDHEEDKKKIKKVQWPQWIAGIGGMYTAQIDKIY